MSNTKIRSYTKVESNPEELNFLCWFYQNRFEKALSKNDKFLIMKQFKQDVHNFLKGVSKSKLNEMAFKQEWDLIFEESWQQGMKTNITEVGFILHSKLSK